jgi:hypothetical protein
MRRRHIHWPIAALQFSGRGKRGARSLLAIPVFCFGDDYRHF